MSLRLKLLRGEIRNHRHREQSRNQGQGLAYVIRTLPEQGFQLCPFGVGALALFETRRPLELGDEGVKGAVQVMRRTLIANRGVRRIANAFHQGAGQP